MSTTYAHRIDRRQRPERGPRQFTYTGCRKERGGCGASYGSLTEPAP